MCARSRGCVGRRGKGRAPKMTRSIVMATSIGLPVSHHLSSTRRRSSCLTYCSPLSPTPPVRVSTRRVTRYAKRTAVPLPPRHAALRSRHSRSNQRVGRRQAGAGGVEHASPGRGRGSGGRGEVQAESRGGGGEIERELDVRGESGRGWEKREREVDTVASATRAQARGPSSLRIHELLPIPAAGDARTLSAVSAPARAAGRRGGKPGGRECGRGGRGLAPTPRLDAPCE